MLGGLFRPSHSYEIFDICISGGLGRKAFPGRGNALCQPIGKRPAADRPEGRECVPAFELAGRETQRRFDHHRSIQAIHRGTVLQGVVDQPGHCLVAKAFGRTDEHDESVCIGHVKDGSCCRDLASGRRHFLADARAHDPQGLFGDRFWKVMKPDIDRAKHDWLAKSSIALQHLTKLGRNPWILSAIARERFHLGDQIVRREHGVGALADVAGRKRILRVTPARFAQDFCDEFVLIYSRKLADEAHPHERFV